MFSKNFSTSYINIYMRTREMKEISEPQFRPKKVHFQG